MVRGVPGLVRGLGGRSWLIVVIGGGVGEAGKGEQGLVFLTVKKVLVCFGGVTCSERLPWRLLVG